MRGTVHTLEHGRLESRAIWTTTRLNDYLNFPHVGQAFAIERQRIEKKTGKVSTETIYGLTDHTPESADAARLLAFNRDHWGVEAHHYILDWNWDEDRCTLRTGHGPENVTRPQCPACLRLSAHDRQFRPPNQHFVRAGRLEQICRGPQRPWD